MASKALSPRAGLDEWPDAPCTAIDSIATPLCARTGHRPVGSPITAAAAFGTPRAARWRAPSIELSSSAVATMVSGCFSRLVAWRCAAASARGKKPFMSQLPRP